MSVTPPPLPPSSGGGTGDPDPRPAARPLDRDEELRLSGLEQELRRSDPELDTELGAPPRPAGGRADRILQAVAIAVIVLVVVPGEWVAGLLSFGLLLGIPAAMAWIAVRAHRENVARERAEGSGDDRT
ncbi:DUF3040 domain-containing protein [Pseudonocardia sp. ICBG1293]|uniref:DUF3040 domain-containing protein n=1 Tax=Pseudonocardia sp. ICBG1293 TaxID=2844382 RepID=UPI001CC9E19F|nr:DUF3040 domain-containing protein [Pseudonocardia sp. ICBG1293]